jgi:hypothetical protein
MNEIIQHEDPEEFPSNRTGNGSHLPPREEEQGTRSRMNQPASRKANGTRTVHPPMPKEIEGRHKYRTTKKVLRALPLAALTEADLRPGTRPGKSKDPKDQFCKTNSPKPCEICCLRFSGPAKTGRSG